MAIGYALTVKMSTLQCERRATDARPPSQVPLMHQSSRPRKPGPLRSKPGVHPSRLRGLVAKAAKGLLLQALTALGRAPTARM